MQLLTSGEAGLCFVRVGHGLNARAGLQSQSGGNGPQRLLGASTLDQH